MGSVREELNKFVTFQGREKASGIQYLHFRWCFRWSMSGGKGIKECKAGHLNTAISCRVTCICRNEGGSREVQN